MNLNAHCVLGWRRRKCSEAKLAKRPQPMANMPAAEWAGTAVQVETALDLAPSRRSVGSGSQRPLSLPNSALRVIPPGLGTCLRPQSREIGAVCGERGGRRDPCRSRQ